MSSLHLISHHLCPYVQRAAIVLIEKDIPHQRSWIDLADKPQWFRELSPLGRVPVLETEGTVLFESQVIAEYLDETTPGSLHPVDPLEKARHRAWIEYGSQVLAVIGGFYSAPDAAAFAAKQTHLRSLFERINPEIAGPYFGGAQFHMIDGVWGTVFRYFDVFDSIQDFGVLNGLEPVQRWRQAVAARESVQAAVPTGYANRLAEFLRARQSHLGALARQSAATPQPTNG